MIYLGQDPVGINIAKATDVEINGTSITENGVANIPLATNSNLGVVKWVNNYGVFIDNGVLKVDGATDAQIKSGTSAYRPIVPDKEHKAVFYGLALASGDSTQSASGNSVGTYTEEAKIAIQKMLGIYRAPYELINEETFTNNTEADYTITTDSNGEPFQLTDIIMWFETPTQETYSKKGYYGQIHYYMNNNDALCVMPEPGGWEQQPNAYSHGFVVIGEQHDNMMVFYAMANTTYTNSGAMRFRYTKLDTAERERASGIFPINNAYVLSNECYFHKIIIKSVTGTGHYKLYGKRKWT